MPRPRMHDDARIAAFVLGASRTRYLVMRQDDAWFITFNGEEFGPYQSEREAMLFAIDAAHKLGETGEDTQVFRVHENGEPTGMELRSRRVSTQLLSWTNPRLSWPRARKGLELSEFKLSS